MLALLVGHVGGIDADAFVELFLEMEKFFELVGLRHKARHYQQSAPKITAFRRARPAGFSLDRPRNFPLVSRI